MQKLKVVVKIMALHTSRKKENCISFAKLQKCSRQWTGPLKPKLPKHWLDLVNVIRSNKLLPLHTMACVPLYATGSGTGPKPFWSVDIFCWHQTFKYSETKQSYFFSSKQPIIEMRNVVHCKESLLPTGLPSSVFDMYPSKLQKGKKSFSLRQDRLIVLK